MNVIVLSLLLPLSTFSNKVVLHDVPMEKVIGGKPLFADQQPTSITESSCPLGCSARGKCENDPLENKLKCLCNPGYVGTGCQQSHYQGYGLLFKGKQSVFLPPMGTTTSMTVSFWMRLSSLPNDDEEPHVIYHSTNDDQQKGTVIVSITKEGRMQFVVHGNKPSTAVFKSDKHPPLKIYEWHHIGITYSKRHAGRTGTGSTTLYMDGKPVETLGYSGAAGTTVDVTFQRGVLGQSFHGVLDEFVLFKRANTPNEMQKRIFGRLSGKEDNILSYYRFDEGSMGTVLDHTPVDPPQVDIPHDGTLGLDDAAPIWVLSWAPYESCVLRCSMQGSCQYKSMNGVQKQVCQCFNGYTGDNCEVQLCYGDPGPCSGHGDCTQKKAMYVPGYVPSHMPTVNEIKKEASYLRNTFEKNHILTESMNQTVASSIEKLERETKAAMDKARNELIWSCDCKNGWSGNTCGNRQCPGDCTGHGLCQENGECKCQEGFRGIDCSILTCPNDCSNNGQCMNGTCVCDAGYSGDDCGSVNICPNDCSGHGRCENRYLFLFFWIVCLMILFSFFDRKYLIFFNSECWCEPMYTGDDCSWAASCYNFCSGRGKCVSDSCLCDPLFTGIDCSEPRCPRDCSMRGDCIDGICLCEAGFDGEGCERELLFPFRCSAQRHGYESSTSCKRGLAAMGVLPPSGVQVLKVQFEKNDKSSSGAQQVISPL
jgi:hypothetical protein